jgi:Xaa-Pro aminopeptidase
MPFQSGRFKSLRRRMGLLDAFLITKMHNVRYLTGFTGSAGFALVTRSENIFVTDFRYGEQAHKEVEGWDIVVEKSGGPVAVKRLGKKLGIRSLGFEASVDYGYFESLRKSFRNVKPMKAVVEKMRAVKEKEELRSIREAVKIAEKAFRKIKPHIKAGAKEKSIAFRLEERLRKEGSGGLPFDIIVASGENSAMPHAKATGRKLGPGDLVIIDWGARADGYCSDMTRTFLIKGGKDIRKKKEIYSLVLRANRKAAGEAAPGAHTKSIDNSARDVINRAGYGEYFGHATGHGVGLDVHEGPGISRQRSVRVREGMVFTIEPGIYVPGLGGVRIEDMVAVGSKGAVGLTSLPRRLEII